MTCSCSGKSANDMAALYRISRAKSQGNSSDATRLVFPENLAVIRIGSHKEAQVDVVSQWQRDANGRAAAGTGFDFDPPAMRFDDTVHNRQAQTAPFSLAGFEQRGESPRPLLLGHAVA